MFTKENLYVIDKLPLFGEIYPDVASAKEKYIRLYELYTEKFFEPESFYLFSAPGRTEIGGNHTDHNHGCVLAGSVLLTVICIRFLVSTWES